MKPARPVNGHAAGTVGPVGAWYSFAGMEPSVTPALEPQSAGAVLMVRPARFGFNPETAASNAFQSAAFVGSGAGPRLTALQEEGLREFDGLVDTLDKAGAWVFMVNDTPAPVKPDAVFPNNWVSFHRDGTVVLYPMLAPNRRRERREDLLQKVIAAGGFRVARTVDLTHREAQSKFLEGTGSLVLDRMNRVAYASLSPRTDLDVLGEFAQQMHYDLVMFEAFDAADRPVYHTNVLMAVGTGFAVVCGEVIPNARHRTAVVEKLRATGHDVIEISQQQMRHFAGNILELTTGGGVVIAMSTAALSSFAPEQRRTLERHGRIVAADVPVIERFGGGGVRCMMAEIHLPTR